MLNKEQLMVSKLTLAYSTCPNDTFIFHALKYNLINRHNLDFDIKLADVEELNLKAKNNIYDISKLSFAAIGHLQQNYGLLRTGAAVGRGCGPLIVARKDYAKKNYLNNTPCKIAIPGVNTTANMLLQLYLLEGKNTKLSSLKNYTTTSMIFDKIMPALYNNEFQLGVIIHEGRFTYKNYDLICIADLGQWWEKETGLPIPLGGIAVKRNIPIEIIKKIESVIGESIKYGFKNQDASIDYIKQYAQEIEDSIIKEHINLYVNDFSINLGKEGEKAIEEFFKKAKKHHLLPEYNQPIFAC